MHQQKAILVFALFTLLSFHAKSQNDLIYAEAKAESDSISVNQKTRFKTFGLFLFQIAKKDEQSYGIAPACTD